jgi:hypothetical protein
MFFFYKSLWKNIDNDANLDQVIDETSTILKEFAMSSESECLFPIMYADDSFCEQILKRWKEKTKHVLCPYETFQI